MEKEHGNERFTKKAKTTAKSDTRGGQSLSNSVSHDDHRARSHTVTEAGSQNDVV